MEPQRKMQQLTENVTIHYPPFDVFEAAKFTPSLDPEMFRPMASLAQESILAIADTLEKVSNTALASARESMTLMMQNMGNIMVETLQSPFLDWVRTFDYSPIAEILKNFSIYVDLAGREDELDKAYLQAMYECEWFPYAGLNADMDLFTEISDILATSRGKSKRRTARIDKVILSSYTPKNLKDMKVTWRNSDLERPIQKMLCQAVNAHIRGEYALTISCLAPMWEELIHYKTNIVHRRNNAKTVADFKELVVANDWEPIFHDYYENMIMSQINTPADIKDGVPNRHGISHGKYKKYPNRKASLNAILLTDFIMNLEPIDLSKETEGNVLIMDNSEKSNS